MNPSGCTSLLGERAVEKRDRVVFSWQVSSAGSHVFWSTGNL